MTALKVSMFFLHAFFMALATYRLFCTEYQNSEEMVAAVEICKTRIIRFMISLTVVLVGITVYEYM
ncbi:MAG: hypothetical protein WBL19_03390 [Minisyncoccia bacterium]